MLRTPITLITGPLGSGKTTLLRHILATRPSKIAIVMNEFGEIGIDTKVIKGKNVRIAELGGGCVCCSLLGEFEAAVTEIMEKIAPEIIVVETTGLAEPEALVFNIQEALPQCRLDGVVSVIDADMLVRFPDLGHTTRLQIEGADILLLNKIDLVDAKQIEPARNQAARNQFDRGNYSHRAVSNRSGTIVRHRTRERKGSRRPQHEHQPEFESFTFSSDQNFLPRLFRTFRGRACPERDPGERLRPLSPTARSFSISWQAAGSWNLLKPIAPNWSLSGKRSQQKNLQILHALDKCQVNNDEARMTNDERMTKPK